MGCEVLLYDLTSTYFECDSPGHGKRRQGNSRDKRPDCVQVVIAFVITPEGFPVAYEVMARLCVSGENEHPAIPSYAPRLNPDEAVWSLAKRTPANSRPDSVY